MNREAADLLKKGLDILECRASPEARELLALFCDLLTRRNREVNLVAQAPPQEWVIRHFLDSAAAHAHLPALGSLLDVGSGAGFPGIVLSILRPSLRVTLVESKQKKCDFLEEVVQSLSLKNTRVLCQNVKEMSGQFDGITARAYGVVEKIIRMTSHLRGSRTEYFLYKGRKNKITEELKKNPGLNNAIIALNVPFLDAERHLVRIFPTS